MLAPRAPAAAADPARAAEDPALETRPYFVLGDLLANGAAGATVGAVCALLFDPGWNMFAAMFVGMALGMLLALPLALLFGAFFGAMEVMVPAMTTGMMAGMVVAMVAAMHATSALRGVELGVWCGIGVLAATYAANALIRRGASQWTK